MTELSTLLRTTAQRIRESKTFMMQTLYHGCGSPGCIFGHMFPQIYESTNFLAPFGHSVVTKHFYSSELKLSLFLPTFEFANWCSTEGQNYITDEHAARQCDALADIVDSGVVLTPGVVKESWLKTK